MYYTFPQSQRHYFLVRQRDGEWRIPPHKNDENIVIFHKGFRLTTVIILSLSNDNMCVFVCVCEPCETILSSNDSASFCVLKVYYSTCTYLWMPLLQRLPYIVGHDVSTRFISSWHVRNTVHVLFRNKNTSWWQTFLPFVKPFLSETSGVKYLDHMICLKIEEKINPQDESLSTPKRHFELSIAKKTKNVTFQIVFAPCILVLFFRRGILQTKLP